MGSVQADYSFARDGVTLAEWLLRLISDDHASREAAAGAITAMKMGYPSADTKVTDLQHPHDFAGQRKRFGEALHATVSSPSFPQTDFVARLCDYLIAASDAWASRHAEAMAQKRPIEEKAERISAKLVPKINAGDEVASKRFDRAMGASIALECEIDQRFYDSSEARSSARTQAGAVFDGLDIELLAAPDALRRLLAHKRHSRDALEALTRIGPPAIAFVPQVAELMDKTPDLTWRMNRDAAWALGTIGRGNGDVIESLYVRLEDSQPHIRASAAQALTAMGTEVGGRERAIVDRLLKNLGDESFLYFNIPALASVGRHVEAARQSVLEFARPRPPKWVSPPEFPDVKLDSVMHERGVAIDAMKYLTDYPHGCVPILIEAIHSFEEYDPDLTYGGPVARVAKALERFGSSAAAAAEPLAHRVLANEESDYPQAILEALTAMGPAAKAALPQLLEYRRRDMEDSLFDEPLDPLDRAIRAVSGTQPGKPTK